MDYDPTLAGALVSGLAAAYFLGSFATAVWVLRKTFEMERKLVDVQGKLEVLESMQGALKAIGTRQTLEKEGRPSNP